MKCVVVGGGSTYTPELVDGFARLHDVLPLSEVVLVDVDATRLARVGAMCQRILRTYGEPYRLVTTGSLETAVDGADVVLIQLRVGGQAARLVDERLPLECGCIGQETTGPGGLAKALRTVPRVLEIADVVRRRAPQAWIIDFTNPVGIVTRALLDAGHRAVGLCNVAIGLQRFLAGLLQVTPDRVALDHVGLNHLSWERAVLLDGVDVLPQLLDDHLEEIATRVKLPADVITHLGVVPSYYLRYYYRHDAILAVQRTSQSRAEEVADIEEKLLALYDDPSVVAKPAILEQRGGAFYSEAAVQLAGSLLGSTPGRHVVNVRNAGTFDALPDEAVVEVPAQVEQDVLRTVPLVPLAPHLRGLVAGVSAYEELAVAAAVRGEPRLVERALLAHPLVGQWDTATGLAGRILAENRAFLPWAV